MKKNRLIFIIPAVIVLVTVFSARFLASLYTDFLWYDAYNQTETFWTLFLARFFVHTAFSAVFFVLSLIVTVILHSTMKNDNDAIILNSLGIKNAGPVYFAALAVILVLLSYVAGAGASVKWKEILLFFTERPDVALVRDPIFGLDTSFYFFTLPFITFVRSWLLFALFLFVVFSAAYAALYRHLGIQRGMFYLSNRAKGAAAVYLVFFLILHAAGIYLHRYQLLFQRGKSFYGAGYTAVHSGLFSIWCAIILTVIGILAVIVLNIMKKTKQAIITAVSVFFAGMLINFILPSLQQRFIVEPNELALELPFIKENIKSTRTAYGLGEMQTREFAAEDNINASVISANPDVIDNIRLWDWRPLLQTYRQIQELKPYYNFFDIDVDRYDVDGSPRAFNLAPRELSTEKLSPDARTWMNQHLVYTHGYGLVMSRVDRITPDGLPELIVQDIPPRGDFNLIPEKVQVYYGEHNNGYCITNTNLSPGEFDYPHGDTNKYTVYDGNGGIKMGGMFRRLAYALTFGDINLLISPGITKESRIHYNRNILQIIGKLAPYLMTDRDPYIVSAGDKLYFFIDAYTSSDRFPYSTPVRFGNEEVNYITNSAKIVIDAYDGSTSIYTNGTDPLITAWVDMLGTRTEKIEAMPNFLKKHLRYPEGLFNVQTAILLRYHMTDPNVFYNNEDAWEIPRQIYDSAEVTMESNYLVTRLPGQEKPGFIIMMPFTPRSKDNMIAFLVAQCDGDDYGNLLLYRLPKDKLTYGPMQIESRVTQDPEISKQLTLWNQKGSAVIRGNILAVPVGDSLLYIEPLYLKAETSEMPELKRVIASSGDTIVMEENLEKALLSLFGSGAPAVEETAEAAAADEESAGSAEEQQTETEQAQAAPTGGPVGDLARSASRSYSRAMNQLKEGDFAGFGKSMKELEETLKKLEEASATDQ